MRYLVFSTIGNENFGDESMATNYINKNIKWENSDLISSYESIIKKKYQEINVRNIFKNLVYKNKVKRILFMISGILEKAVRITGTTRSTIDDFEKASEMLNSNQLIKALNELVLSINNVDGIAEYYKVFEMESVNTTLGKHIIKLNL